MPIIYTRIDSKLKKRIEKICKEKYMQMTVCQFIRLAVKDKVIYDEFGEDITNELRKTNHTSNPAI